MKLFRVVCLFCILFGSIPGGFLQAQTPLTAFEVASIKQAPPIQTLMMEIQSGRRGIGSLQSTINDGRVDLGYVSLSNMLMIAYELKEHQIVGPDWLGSQAYEVHAKLPEGSSKNQVPEMLRSLLEERFRIEAHRENRKQSVYALIVSKDGHNLTKSVMGIEDIEASRDSAQHPPTGGKSGNENRISINIPGGELNMREESGGMVLDGGKNRQMRINMGPDGTMFLEVDKITMSDFTDILTQFSDRPVVDRTGLAGFYKLTLEIPIEDLMSMAQKIAPTMGIPLPPGIGGAGSIVGDSPGIEGLTASSLSGSGIHQAIRKLGLELDSRKAPVEMLIIDHIEKAPTEN